MWSDSCVTAVVDSEIAIEEAEPSPVYVRRDE